MNGKERKLLSIKRSQKKGKSRRKNTRKYEHMKIKLRKEKKTKGQEKKQMKQERAKNVEEGKAGHE